jgi:hypothetical protein
MKARHEFTTDKKYYDYVKVWATIEFIKSAIIADSADEDTLTETAVKLSSKMIEELIKDKKDVHIS